MTNQHDPAAVAGWRKCRCEWCLEDLKIRGLPLDPDEPAATPPKPAKQTNAERDAEIRKLFAAGATVQELGEEYHLTPVRISQICKGIKRHPVEA